MGWRRVTVCIVYASACALSGNSQPQAAACSTLHFEVASVKPAPQSRDRRATGRFGLSPGRERYEAINITPLILILEAFQVDTVQIVGVPDWMTRERWDVIGKPERPASPREMHCMLRNLLVDRFHLAFHLEKRSLPADVLTVNITGSKLRETGAAVDFSFEQTPGPFDHQIHMHGTSLSMDYIGWRLALFLGLPVSDQTGLKGRYDIDLVFVEEVDPEILERRMAGGHGIDTHPTLFEALRQQLGLRLSPGKGPVEVIVIDHVEKPGPN